MAEHNDFFHPQHIDEQIEQVERQVSSNTSSLDTAARHTVQSLQRLYEQEAQHEVQSLSQAHARVMHKLRIHQAHQTQAQQGQEMRVVPMRTRDTRNTDTPYEDYDYTTSNRRPTFVQRLSTVAAVVFVCLLVGSMATVFYMVRHDKASNTTIVGSGPGHSTPTRLTLTPTVKPASPSGTIGHTIATMQQDTGVYDLTWSPDSTEVATAGSTIDVWNATSGKHILRYTPPNNVGASIYQVRWSPDGTRIASTGSSVQVWNAATGKILVTYTPPAGQASVTNNSATALRTNNSTSTIYDNTLMTKKALSGGSNITAVAWSPDSQYIASTSYVNSTDYSVQVWNATTGVLKTKYTGHTDSVFALAWSPEGKYIASAGRDGSVQVWEAMTGRQVYAFHRNSGLINSVAWSPNGKSIASADENGGLYTWDAFTGTHVVTYTAKGSYVSSVSWSPDGTRLASAGSANVQVWDTHGNNIYTYTGNTGSVRAVAWSPNGKYIASGDTPGEASNAPGILNVWLAS